MEAGSLGRRFLCFGKEVKGEQPCYQKEVTVTGTVSPYTSHASLLSLGYTQKKTSIS